MTVKEKVIRESIDRIEKRIKKIKHIVYANPLSDIISGRIEVLKILEDNKGDYAKIAKLIEPYAVSEKANFKLAKLQEGAGKLIDEQVEIENELYNLHAELYWIEKKK